MLSSVHVTDRTELIGYRYIRLQFSHVLADCLNAHEYAWSRSILCTITIIIKKEIGNQNSMPLFDALQTWHLVIYLRYFSSTVYLHRCYCIAQFSPCHVDYQFKLPHIAFYKNKSSIKYFSQLLRKSLGTKLFQLENAFQTATIIGRLTIVFMNNGETPKAVLLQAWPLMEQSSY